MDSLRYWVEQVHVDGFRFDLATVLGREAQGFDPNGGFFDAIRQDPVLSRVKLIAEPWDIGPGGYQLGAYPHPFLEWNDRFRDGVRRSGGRCRDDPRPGRPPAGQRGKVRPFGPRRDLVGELSSPAMTASPCTTWCPTPSSATGPMARTTATATPKTTPTTWGSKARRTSPRSRPRGRCASATCWRRCCCRRVCRCCWRGRDRPQPGRQQQRLCPGQRHQLDRTGTRRCRAGGLCRAADGAAPGASGAAPAPVPACPRPALGRPARRDLAPARWLGTRAAGLARPGLPLLCVELRMAAEGGDPSREAMLAVFNCGPAVALACPTPRRAGS
jgi:hypothetical protein